MRATLAALLLLMLSLSGCINTGSDAGEFSVDEVEKPGWEVGDWWLYTFETAQFGHHHVKQNQIWLETGHFVERILAVDGDFSIAIDVGQVGLQ